MKYKILENFIDKNFCNALIKDANLFSKNDYIKVLNNRLILPSSSLAFLKLINNSKPWKELHNQLNSQDFLKTILKALDLNEKNFEVTNFFFNHKPSTFLKKYKLLNSKKISTIGNLNLFFYAFYKIYRYLIRKFKFTFTSKNYVELLYDYSKSPNGYKREIHRDSDSRTIVFLIYFNSITQDGKGGNLELYKYKKNERAIPSRPDTNDCKLIETILPEAGKLVTFLNSNTSLHAVSEMTNCSGYRHFLYGSFTLLGKKNNLIKSSVGSLKTNYNFFE